MPKGDVGPEDGGLARRRRRGRPRSSREWNDDDYDVRIMKAAR
jgi:hypothetical protein